MARALRGRFEPSDHFVLGHPSTLELLSALRSPVGGSRFKPLIYVNGFGAGACGGLASKSKYLAQMNKTQDVGRATEGCSALQSLLSWCRAEGPNSLRSRSALLAPAFNGRGLFHLWQ